MDFQSSGLIDFLYSALEQHVTRISLRLAASAVLLLLLVRYRTATAFSVIRLLLLAFIFSPIPCRSIVSRSMEWSSQDLSETKKCCTDCKTTKTPLWRGGPAGPKTLCNACGIRYRKRRASSSAVGMSKGQERKREREQNGSSGSAETVGVGGSSDLRECLKVKLVALGEEVLLQRSPPFVVKKQRWKKLGEEEQAAVCLMALSCGFVFA
ncbi:hypothetical protein VNO77_18291 [Canavalia gladiata]|uniref:GATA-type domain-containing protein n=1 Tax=Canavalia gladiata TaxID=3824 RepID=A0AAN9LL91_CANGL